MKIGIDARSLVEKKTGFGFFLENILLELFQLDKTNEYILFSDRKVVFDISQYKNVTVHRYNDTLLFPKSFYYFYRLASHLRRENIKLDVFWGTQHLMPQFLSESTKKVLTVHDFTHIKFPQSTTRFNRIVSGIMFAPSVDSADVIACISKNTQKELQELLPKALHGQQILTIYESGNPNNTTENEAGAVSDDVLKAAKQKYILFLGTIEPRKNIPLLIEAAPRLKGRLHVVICGKIGWEQQQVVSKLYSTDNLTYLNYVSQAEKQYLLSNCACQVQPSLYEGFGLPVVESMQSGVVAFVADNSSLKELVEMEELRFETENVEDFCSKLLRLEDDRQLYDQAKQYCNMRAKEFDWKKTAAEYHKIFCDRA